MKTVKIGVFGIYRGGTFYDTIRYNNGEIVAVCDKDESRLAEAKEKLGDDLATYTNFEDFINHEGLEAVFLSNYFCEHAPYAVKALEKGIHVLSECASNSTMAEGVALVRACEKSGAFYMISENYPFMKFNHEINRIAEGGTLGKILYGEGEYNHPHDPRDRRYNASLRPFSKHWRVRLPRSYYVTHALAPLMYFTGATPKRVTAMACYAPFDQNDPQNYCQIADRAAIIMTQNDDDSVFRVTGCAAFAGHENSYRLCGTKGQVENLRESNHILLRYNEWDAPEGMSGYNCYLPEWNDPDAEAIEKIGGHHGGDFLVMREFLNCIRENRKPRMDVYFATAMASVGILAHRSILEGGTSYDIPDFRKEEDRVKYENDNLTPFWGSDGSEPTLPSCSRPEGEPLPEKLLEYDEYAKEMLK